MPTNADNSDRNQEIATGLPLLLELLDPDPDNAYETYHRVCTRLEWLISSRGCDDSATRLDKMIDKICERLAGGLVIRQVHKYLAGAARRAGIDCWRHHRALERRIDKMGVSQSSPKSKSQLETLIEQSEEDALRKALRLACKDFCIDMMKPEQRLMFKGYAVPEGNAIAARKRLADLFRLTRGALRMRVSRIRRRLLDCIQQCVDVQDVGLKHPALRSH